MIDLNKASSYFFSRLDHPTTGRKDRTLRSLIYADCMEIVTEINNNWEEMLGDWDEVKQPDGVNVSVERSA